MNAPRNVVLRGDCLEVMRGLPAESVDAVVTDPPYELGFMGKSWDSAGVSFSPATWAEALRVLKPGGHLLAFGGSRTYHRIAVAIEDAGFEIRDTISWLYGSGFPKSLDVSKAIDKAAGAEREVVGTMRLTGTARIVGGQGGATAGRSKAAYADATIRDSLDLTAPATDAAKQWEGWGTALKPAHEPVIVARKPLIGTVAANVLMHGTGALNIDGGRIGGPVETWPSSRSYAIGHMALSGRFPSVTQATGNVPAGRWPTNVILDEEAAAQLDEQAGERKSGGSKHDASLVQRNTYGKRSGERKTRRAPDTGGASRFFYVAKAGKKERNAGSVTNTHPTVKPITLMRYLIRLVTPPGGVVLDPFLGSGTTACAAVLEGFDYIGIEREPAYADIAEARIAHWMTEAAKETQGTLFEEDGE